jgi:hypothetical protein
MEICRSKVEILWRIATCNYAIDDAIQVMRNLGCTLLQCFPRLVQLFVQVGQRIGGFR